MIISKKKTKGSNKMQQYVVANWKMYLNTRDAHKLSESMAKKMQVAERPLPKLVLCPSFPHLIPVFNNIKGTAISLGAQNCHTENNGPHTGEVGPEQLKDIQAEYVIIGHSERRRHHNESSEEIKRKLEAVIAHGMIPILCVGETIEERRSGKTIKKIEQQLRDETPEEFTPNQLIIAYEPVWSIGTNITPTEKEIEDVHGAIQYELQQLQPNGNLVPILYGGSVHTQNAATILKCSCVHGLLVGRHAINAENLWAVVTAAEE